MIKDTRNTGRAQSAYWSDKIGLMSTVSWAAVLKKVVDIENRYSNLCQKISLNVDESSQMVNSQIEYIVKKINE